MTTELKPEDLEWRKKPVVIEAWQWQLENRSKLPDWLLDTEVVFGRDRPGKWRREGDSLVIHTLEGDHRAQPGDWIIKGIQGELYPCKPDIFAATYELAALSPPPLDREEGARKLRNAIWPEDCQFAAWDDPGFSETDRERYRRGFDAMAEYFGREVK